MRAKRFFLILVVVNILLIGAIGAVFVYASKIAAQKSKTIASLKADYESNAESIGNLSQLQTTLKKNNTLGDLISSILPQDKEQSKALADLNVFAGQTGIDIQEVNFNAGTNKAAGQTLTSPSSLSGVQVLSAQLKLGPQSYNQLLDFLNKIEDNRRRMQVTSVSLVPTGNAAGDLKSVLLGIDIYLKP